MKMPEELFKKAKKLNVRIGFPESEDKRVLEACFRIKKKGIANPIIIGESNVKDIEKVSPDNKYSEQLYELRKEKGLSKKEAEKLSKKPLYYALMMLRNDELDGVIYGATRPTADTIRAALQIIGSEGMASSHTLMITKDKDYLFADCGFVIQPDSKQLAEIALSTVESASLYNIKPRVAMLSFSTKGSGKHKDADKVITATKIIQKKNPKLKVEGELQLDAAIIPTIADRKAPDSQIKGDANILIFPDLDAGNIGYKLVERFGGAKAIGPIIQGLKKPVNDLSRGCSVEDIVILSAITALQKR